jgi:hypothetical protein
MSEEWPQHQLAKEMPETVAFRGRSKTDIQKRRDFLHSSQLRLEREGLETKLLRILPFNWVFSPTT